jgi:hypothetical protein
VDNFLGVRKSTIKVARTTAVITEPKDKRRFGKGVKTERFEVNLKPWQRLKHPKRHSGGGPDRSEARPPVRFGR